MATDPISSAILQHLDAGRYVTAARVGETLAVEQHDASLSPTFYGLLVAAHLGAGSFPAARLAAVRAAADVSDRTVEYLGRLLEARSSGRYADAINALKSAPAQVQGVFREILVCELAWMTAATGTAPLVADVARASELPVEEVAAHIAKKGGAFGVAVVPGSAGALTRVAATPAAEKDAAAASRKIASVELITEAALMTAAPVDRYWR